ncbi:pectinesterase family protein [Cellulomonas sp. NS3]|uniref:pectinesterase family protein n=1 Tax=Cellulomonas sp. NS3 TaxID=2973977 RepID=UPI002162E6F7|nr:pectinesterase family protein [Cellulomonas sp. NS3]
MPARRRTRLLAIPVAVLGLVLGAFAPAAAATAPDLPGGTAPDGTRAGAEADRPAHGHDRPDATVSADGRADFPSVQAAIDAAPEGATEPWVIAVRPGEYRELVKVPATKPFLTLVGTGRRAQDVVIAYDNANGTPKPDGTGTHGTSGSASVTVDGADFTARNLTFANLFDEAAHPEITNRQAVAVLTRADRLVFDGVRFLGNQDTLYVNSSSAAVVARAWFRDCYVEGDVDFVFGRATAVFEGCEIRSLTRGSATNNGYVTAPSTMIANPYGFLFTRCRFTSDAPAGTVFLGRPWHPSNDPDAVGQVLVRDSWIGAHVGATAWSDFSGGWSWRGARFAEHHNRGPGALVTPDRPQLTRAEAAAFTPRTYLAGDDGWAPFRRS